MSGLLIKNIVLAFEISLNDRNKSDARIRLYVNIFAKILKRPS